MGHNHSSPSSPRHPLGPHSHQAYHNHLRELDYENSDRAPKSNSFVNNPPPLSQTCCCRGKRLSCHNVLSSFNEENEVRVSSTTIKSKRSSTIKSYNTSQEPRKSEDFDIGQMDENADLRKKQASFMENTPYLDSALMSNDILSKIGTKRDNLPHKNRSSIFSSSQAPSTPHHREIKLDLTNIGPHFDDNHTHRLPKKEVEDDLDIVMKTEICEKDEEPFEIRYKDRMDSPLCMMESMEIRKDKYKDKDDEVQIGDSNGSSPNRPTKHYFVKNTTSRIGEDYPRGLKRPVLTTSFEEEQIEPSQIKNLDIISVYSDEVYPPKSPKDELHVFSPNKAFKSNRILERRDGIYQEVEFSFKPNRLSKGSQRYTSEGDNVAGAIHSIENPLFDHKDELEIETDLISNLHFHSPRFISSPLSLNQVRFESSSKSSAVYNKNSPQIKQHYAKDRSNEKPRQISPKDNAEYIAVDNTPKGSKHQASTRPSHYIDESRPMNIKYNEDSSFTPSSNSCRAITPLKDLDDYHNLLEFPSSRMKNLSSLKKENKMSDDSKENRPHQQIPALQPLTKLQPRKNERHPNHTLRRELQKEPNPQNSSKNSRESNRDSKECSSATQRLKEHSLLKKIINQGNNPNRDSKRSSSSLKQDAIKNKSSRLRFAQTFIEQPQESFQIDDSIARLERRKRSMIEDLNSIKTPSEYYRIQIKDSYAASPMLGGSNSFAYPVRPTKRPEGMQVDIGHDTSPRTLQIGTPSGTDSRALADSKCTSATAHHQSKKLCKNCRVHQEMLNEPTTSKANRYPHSHQVSPKREEINEENQFGFLTSKKKLFEKSQALKSSRQYPLKAKNSKIQLYLDSTAELPDRPFSRLTPNRQQETGMVFAHDPVAQLEKNRKDGQQRKTLQRRF